MLESVYKFDWKVFQFIEAHIWNPVLDVILKIITTTGKWGAIFMVIAVGLFVYGFFTKKDKPKQAAMAVAFSIVIMEVVSNLIVKRAFARPRPFNFDWSQYAWAGQFNFPEIVSRPDSYSFPSGHATSAFAGAFALNRYDKKWGAAAYVFAAVMAFSRVYLHVHYCTDVLAGAVFGLLYGLIGYLIVKYTYKFFDEKIFRPIEKLFKIS
ncbi:MAG: phosphatase PAP2 family protein [Acutalibacteraceae bacterium]